MTALPIRAVIYGIRDIKPIVNVSHSAIKVRVRTRNDDMAKAYVRYPDRIEVWDIVPTGGVIAKAETWELGQLLAINSNHKRVNR